VTRAGRPGAHGADLRRAGLEALRQLHSARGYDASDGASGLYPALYGRDSLWVVLLLAESLALVPDADVREELAQTGPTVLRSLAALQGERVDESIEEQPGRIPHEYHPTSPSAHAVDMRLPLVAGRSYGGFDETFLFVLAYDALVRTAADEALAGELWPYVERALTWIAGDADPDGDGLFEYLRRNPANLLNEVWKDSFDAATHTGFDVPPQPLAWIEVQAYGWRAMSLAERWSSDRNDPVAAQAWRGRADATAAATERALWLGDEDGYAIAVDGHKEPIRMVASNPGHALWAGAVPDEHVAPLVARMLQPDLMSPYGLRTLSARSPYYAPFAYHRGAVWPFDNAVFTLGLVRHGRHAPAVDSAIRVISALDRIASPVECYAVVDGEHFVGEADAPARLCWRHWPVRNRVQAFSAAALVVCGAVVEALG
jgi:glycogen debranching enzyme